MKETNRKDIIIITILFICGLSFICCYSIFSKFLIASDAATFADCARNLYEGKGLVSNLVTPSFLPYYKEIKLPLPYLWYPLHPIVTSLLFHIFGVKAWVLTIFPITCYILSSIVVYFIGKEVFNWHTGLVSGFLLLIQPAFIQYGISGSTDTLLVFFLLLTILLIFLSMRRNTFLFVLLSGICFGIAQYARSAGVMYYIPILFLIVYLHKEKRIKIALLFIGVCFLAQMPMFYRNYTIIGSFSFSPIAQLLTLTRTFPGDSAFFYLIPTSFYEVFKIYGSDIVYKWLSQIWVHYKYFFTMINPLILVGAIFTLFISCDKKEKALMIFTIVLFIVLAILNSFVIWNNRYLFPVVPFFIILFSTFVIYQINKLFKRKRLLVKLLVVFALVMIVSINSIDDLYQTVKKRHEFPYKHEYDNDLAKILIDNINSNEIVLTDAPDILMWCNRNISVNLTGNLETAQRIYNEYDIKFTTIVITSRFYSYKDYHGFSDEWKDIANGHKNFLDFKIVKSVKQGNYNTVILKSENYLNEI